jgi:protein O-GlcNAc transferase
VLSLPYRSGMTTFERAQLARLAREVGLIDLAIGLLKDGGDEARLREVAEQAWTQRRWDNAARAYAALAELNSDEAEYVSNAAWAVLNGGGDAETAIALLRQAVAKNPDAARNLSRQLTLRGEPYRNDERRGGGRLAGAVFWFSLASRVDPSYDRPEVELGSVYFYRGLYEQAAHHFAEAARRDPRNPSTYNQLADTHLKLGRTPEAIDYYEKGVEIRPDRPELHFNLGRAYSLVGRREDALRELRAALDLAPDNVTYRDELRRVEAGG